MKRRVAMAGTLAALGAPRVLAAVPVRESGDEPQNR
jgi:hypothetical protein